MKKIFLFLVICLSVIGLHAQSLNVMSFNIRLNTASDSLNAWPYRKDRVASQIIFHDAHIIGVQEALHEQMMDLKERLPSYKFAGTGRDDGKTKGEYSAVFYDTARLQLLQTQTFWLSETPGVPGSKSWDAAITRIVTWVRFADRMNGKQFLVFNTHFDHIGKTARKESARLLLSRIQAVKGNLPVIVTGDLNSEPSDEPLKILLDGSGNSRLWNSSEISIEPHYGPEGTFNGFRQKEVSDLPIDYILVSNGITVLKHATLSQSWQGRFSSDHFPVMAVLEFQ